MCNVLAVSFAENGKSVFSWVQPHTCKCVYAWLWQQAYVCVCAHWSLCELPVFVSLCTCEIAAREKEQERGSVSACKLKRLHLCGSALWQKAWVRPLLRGVIDGRVAVVTPHKQAQAVSLFAAWRLSLCDVPLSHQMCCLWWTGTGRVFQGVCGGVCLWGLEAYLNYLININFVFPLTYFFLPNSLFFTPVIASGQIIASSPCLSRSVPQPRPIRFEFKLRLPGLTHVCTASLCFQNDFRVEGKNVKVTFSVRYAAKRWLKPLVLRLRWKSAVDLTEGLQTQS